MPYQEQKRERRRRDLLRMKARAVRLYPEKPKAVFWAEYLAPCSCWMCGNQRRTEKPKNALTRQEHVCVLRMKDDG